MRSLVAVVVVVFAGASASADPAPGPSAKELVDWVDAKLAAINSLEIELETKLPGPAAAAYVSTLTKTDVIQIVRDGGRLRARYESTGITTHACKKPGCKRPMPEPPSKLMMFTDGDESVQYFAGTKTGHKNKAKSERSNTLRLASWLRNSPKLVRADAEGAYVLAATDKGTVTTVSLSPVTGLPIKTVVRLGSSEVTITTKRVETGKQIPVERVTLPADISIE